MLLSEEQLMAAESARVFCTERAPVRQLRHLRDSANVDGFDRDTWREMVDLGWAAIPWPTELGGLDFGYRSLGVITEETGRTLLASPLHATVWMGGTACQLDSNERRRAEFLPKLARGELLVALALEESHHHQPYGSNLAAVRSRAGFRLSGHKTFVIDGHVADKFIVVARTSGRGGERHGLTAFWVESDAQGVSTQRMHLVDSRNAAEVSFDDVVVSADDVLGSVDGGADIIDRVLDAGRIGVAAEMLGSLQECFDRTMAYLRERTQFGVAIGSFQALKHRAAKLYCDVELSRSCVASALVALDDPQQADRVARLASAAKAKVGDTFRQVALEAVQMHGGNGMTDEFDIGLFLKRAAVADVLLGDVRFHRDRYGTLCGH
ncbi:acyl-CoA dehydrogenase family protein [Steroidobacter sp.]|uniref:acyl-CoA dehydrogenase family protein n=1 Tax=Steroidobacter sp. TaxID=1978227 RepID=UPI001A3D13AC|nr:acyl-CoA dehydrogenase family protein [Steroidobacter sp.]MBL8266561.1 acyl-CoA/acyl-ACP dehydrogenase [Steroidobacter sp.]